MIMPMLDDEPILEEIAERNIRENERLKLLLRFKKCSTMQQVEKLLEEMEQSIENGY